jgi:hypothetical protein
MSDETEAIGPEPPGEGRSRRTFALESALGPNSMSGSWVLGFEKDQVTFQGLVVGEFQPGVYCVEIFDQIDSESKDRGGQCQRLMSLEQFLDGDFRFYDDDIWVRRVLDAYQTHKRSEV